MSRCLIRVWGAGVLDKGVVRRCSDKGAVRRCPNNGV